MRTRRSSSWTTPLLLLATAALLAASPQLALAACGDGVLDRHEQCDDGNVADGDCCSSNCTFEEVGSPCTSLDACFGAGVCDDGECVDAEPVVCDDGNPCTTDYCVSDAGGCVAAAIEGCCTVDEECDDSIVCNGLETCVVSPFAVTGSCVAGTPIACDDGDPCTRDACVPSERGCIATLDPNESGCIVEDEDSDGVWDRLDLCPDTPVGLLPDADGCAKGDLAENPRRLIEDSDRAFEKLQALHLADRERRKERRLVTKVRRLLEKAALELGRGQSCASAKLFLKAEKLNEKVLISLDRQRRMAFVRAARWEMPGAGRNPADTQPGEMEEIRFEVLTAFVQGAAAPFVRSSHAVAGLCRVSVQGSTEGIVAEVNSRRSRLLLQDGTVVRMGTAKVKGTPVEGATIVVRGETLGLRDFVAGQVISTANPKLELAPFDIRECWDLRIAPLQPEEDYLNDPESHPFPGYRLAGSGPGGTLWLEQGMALHLKEKCTPPTSDPDASGNYRRYWVDFHGSTKTLFSSTPTTASGYSFQAGRFWTLPATLNGQGKLTVKWFERECNDSESPPCPQSKVQLVREDVYPISINSTGGYCQAQYSQSEFALPDRDPSFDVPDSLTFGALFNKFEQASVLSTTGFHAIMGGTATFGALGYKVDSPTESSFPDLESVGIGEPFAIYPTRDPVLAWRATTYTNTDPIVGVGVARASGLTWPGVSGMRNGAQYRYACTVPTVIRDVVDFCADEPNSYYRLPYFSDLGNVKCGQGNNSNWSHCGAGYPYECAGKYAFDLSVPEGKPVVAARSGTVVWVRTNAKASCHDKVACADDKLNCCVASSGGGICSKGDSAKIGNVCHANAECDGSTPGDGFCGCHGNGVVIEHADGSVGAYYHMLEGMVDVKPGDRILRGDKLGDSGSTGCSTGPHVHFQVNGTAAWSSASIPVRFQTHGGGTCVTPVTGQSYKSNNGNWLSY